MKLQCCLGYMLQVFVVQAYEQSHITYLVSEMRLHGVMMPLLLFISMEMFLTRWWAVPVYQATAALPPFYSECLLSSPSTITSWLMGLLLICLSLCQVFTSLPRTIKAVREVLEIVVIPLTNSLLLSLDGQPYLWRVLIITNISVVYCAPGNNHSFSNCFIPRAAGRNY